MTLIEMTPQASGRNREHRGNCNGRSRPGVAGIRYPGTGVPMSRSPHRRPPATPATTRTTASTVGLALLAALVTAWLGLIAHLGGVAGNSTASDPMPSQLGVVRVQTGESLAHLAARVAPGAPAGQVVKRIRELNRLDSAALEAGQILIAPIG